jgi:hypothetical protein
MRWIKVGSSFATAKARSISIAGLSLEAGLECARDSMQCSLWLSGRRIGAGGSFLAGRQGLTGAVASRVGCRLLSELETGSRQCRYPVPTSSGHPVAKRTATANRKMPNSRLSRATGKRWARCAPRGAVGMLASRMAPTAGQ